MVGVGTNLRPRETTSHSAVERVCPEGSELLLVRKEVASVGV